jgi:hypothetical protein
MGQFVEIADDAAFTAKYSIRTTQMAALIKGVSAAKHAEPHKRDIPRNRVWSPVTSAERVQLREHDVRY